MPKSTVLECCKHSQLLWTMICAPCYRSEVSNEASFLRLSAEKLQDANAAVLYGKDFEVPGDKDLEALRTGDLAKLTKSGVLYCGRNELTVKISGDTISSIGDLIHFDYSMACATVQ